MLLDTLHANQVQCCNADVVLLFVMFVLFAWTMLSFSKRGRVLAMGAASILFSHAQLTAQILSMDVGWPPFFRLAMEWLADLFQLNLPDMAAPECVMDFRSGGAAYMFRLMLSGLLLPATTVLIYLTHFFTTNRRLRRCRCCPRRWRIEKDDESDTESSFDYANSASVSAFSTLYVTLVGSALRTLYCVEVEGSVLLDGNRAIVCMQQGSGLDVAELLLKMMFVLATIVFGLGWSCGRFAVIPAMFCFAFLAFCVLLFDLVADGIGVVVPWRHIAWVGISMLACVGIAFPIHMFWNIHDAGPPPFDRQALRKYGWFISRFRSEKCKKPYKAFAFRTQYFV